MRGARGAMLRCKACGLVFGLSVDHQCKAKNAPVHLSDEDREALRVVRDGVELTWNESDPRTKQALAVLERLIGGG